MDNGRTWQPATLDENYGKYSFRRWQTNIPQLTRGGHSLMVRCTNLSGDVQPAMPNWNNSGFMRNVVETVHVTAI
jgi:Mo-co oxidoreductase dimerisation domain.